MVEVLGCPRHKNTRIKGPCHRRNGVAAAIAPIDGVVVDGQGSEISQDELVIEFGT